MDKENQTRRSYSAAALLRKQAAAAAVSNNAQLPRVAALPASSGRSSRQDGKSAQPRARPLSSLSGSVPNPNIRPPSASAHRVGCKPATHSTRTLVPLLDAAAPGCAPLAPASAASRVLPMPAASSVPAARSAVSVEIGDAGLDSAEAALQQELAQAEQRLELLQQQQARRRSATPDLGPSPASTALSARAHALPLQSGPTPPLVQSSSQRSQQVQLGSTAAKPQQQQHHEPEQQQQQQQQGQQPQQQYDDLVPSPTPSQRPESPYVPPSDQSIVRSIVTTTGTGCKDVIAAHSAATLAAGACWTTRGHRVLHQESSCILQLCGRSTSDITLRITFADAASVPCLVRLEHAPSPSATFERLGDIQLQAKSLKQLRHLFRLGKGLEVQRFMRISLIGHMAQDHSGAHRVSHMLLTSGQGPQRTPSPSPVPDSPPVAGGSMAASAQASAELGNSPDTPTADTAASEASAAAPEDDAPVPAAATETAVPLQSGNCSAVASAAAADEPVPVMLGKAVSSAASSTSGSSGSSIQSAGQQPRERQAVVPASNMPALLQSALPQPRASQPAAPVPDVSRPAPTDPPANPTESLPNNHQKNRGVSGSLDVEKKADADLVAAVAETGVHAAEAAQGHQPAADCLQRINQQERQVQPAKDLQVAPASTAPPPVMLLPMQRCSDVLAVLSRLDLSPQQAKELLLDLLDPAEQSCAGIKLTEVQVEELVGCLPSADERRLLAGFGGRAEQLGTAEQFMLAVMQAPAARERMEARCYAGQAASRANTAATVAAVLGCACVEVAQSDLLRTLLKVSLAAGNFLNAGNQNGTAAGFQIDALLKLKDVRSSRARTRTLLHFVAREVSRQHPESASLLAALPSAAAASRIELCAVKADVLELAAGARQVEHALATALEGAALSSSACSAAAAHLATFRAEVVERVGTVLADLDDADSAFRHLGSFINGQRATLADPAAFFGVLHAFAEELERAHEENAAADSNASAGNAAAKAGRSKDGKPRRQSKATSSANSAAASSGTAQQRASTASSTQEHASSAGQHQPADQGVQAADKEALLERLKQASVEGLQSAAVCAGSQRKQHSPQPCMSKAAIAGIGGSRRSAARAAESGAGSSPRVGVGSAGAQTAKGSQAGDTAAADAAKLSTPVATLLAESARIISSIDCGQGGFGSAIGSSADASGTAAAPAAAEQDTAGTPDGAVRPAAVAEEAGAEAEAGFATPRGMLAVCWPGQNDQAQQGAGEQKQQGSDPAADQHQVQANGEALHVASFSAAGAPAAGAVPAERPAPSHAGSLVSRGTQGTGLSQLRQRSLQQLSPTSTPLSSLGRQSSHCSSSYSSDCGSTPPRPSMRMQGPQPQRSASPLGLGAAVAEAEGQDGAAAAATPAAQASVPTAQAAGLAGGPLLAAERSSQVDLPAEQDLLDLQPAQVLPAQQLSDSPLDAATAVETAAGSGAGQPVVYLPAQHPCGDAGLEAGWVQEGEEEDVLPPMGGFHALHSRASSCDLTYYAPFSMEREPEAFADPKLKARQGLAASFSYGQGGPASALGPLGAHQLRSSGLLRHTSADEAVLAGAAAKAGISRHVSHSMPSSPSRAGHLPAAGRRPPPLNLHGLADRLQVHAEQQAAPPAAGVQGSASQQQQHRRQPSSGLEELLSGVPALLPTPQPELAADDLADLAGLSSDHEVEWQALEQIEKQNAEWQQQQAAEQDMREMLLMQLPAQAAQAQPNGWIPVQQEPAAAAAQHQQELPGAGRQEDGEAAAELAAELAALPSPINANTSDLDAAVARLLASAGHTPTGPLGLGMRGMPADRGVVQAGAAETSAELARASAASTLPGGRQVALLEPVMPAPLGEGIRASTTLGEQVPAAALLKSLECSRATLRRSLTIASGQQPAGPNTTTLSLEAAEWEAAVAAAEAARDGAEGGPASPGGVAFSAAGSSAMEWGAGGGPVRRRGLRRFITARRRHY